MIVEIYSLVEGTLDDTFYTENNDAEEIAEQMATDLAAAQQVQGFDNWQVFILPHYCRSDNECVCAQYLPNHKPFYSSETWQS